MIVLLIESHQQWVTPTTQDEKQYFKELGSRLAQLRRKAGLTQVQLAETLEVSQQMVASYEVGRRRIPVSMLPALAQALKVQIDTLLGKAPKAQSKRALASRLQQQMAALAQLPKAKQQFVSQMLDTVLAQTGR